MLSSLILFLLLLPHALGAASPGVGQVSLCAVLASTVLYCALPKFRTETFLKFLIGPLSCIVLLSNIEQPEQWTLHVAMICLPTALSPTA